MALQGDGKNMWEWLIGNPALQWDDRMGGSRLTAWGGALIKSKGAEREGAGLLSDKSCSAQGLECRRDVHWGPEAGATEDLC